MICHICGGNVEWKGRMSNLTHTECSKCGAMNSQIADDIEDDEPETEYCECQSSPTEEESSSGRCDSCGGIL